MKEPLLPPTTQETGTALTKKIGYTAIIGQSVIVRTVSIVYKANCAQIVFEGQTKNTRSDDPYCQ